MPEITLFGSRQSPFVEKTVRGLQLKGLEFELVEPKRPTDVGKWNPGDGAVAAAGAPGRVR